MITFCDTLALAKVCRALLAAGQISPGPEAVVEAKVGFILQLMRDSGAEGRVAHLFGQRREITVENAVQIFAAEYIVDPVHNGLKRGHVRQLEVSIRRQQLISRHGLDQVGWKLNSLHRNGDGARKIALSLQPEDFG